MSLKRRIDRLEKGSHNRLLILNKPRRLPMQVWKHSGRSDGWIERVGLNRGAAGTLRLWGFESTRTVRSAATVTLDPWDSLKIETGRVWSPIEGHDKTIKEAGLTQYSSR